MNEADMRAVPTFGGWFGEFRTVEKSTWRRVRNNGADRIYPDEISAWKGAWSVLRHILFGPIHAQGERPRSKRTEAEKAFGKLLIRGRQIEIERR